MAIAARESNATIVSQKVNTILRSLMVRLEEMDMAEIKLGQTRACREGWKTDGYAVYAEVRGMVNGGIVFGIDPLMARQMVRHTLLKRFQISDFEFRMAVQMLANDVLVAALDLLAQVDIRMSLSAPQVFSRFEWTKTNMSRIPMIEVPLTTAYGVCQLAFNLRPA